MYKIMMDGEILYYPGDKESVIVSPNLKLQAGYAGEFSAAVPMSNPLYGKIFNRQSMISIYRDEKEIFYGEIVSQQKDWLKNKSIYCAGALSFLADSIQPQAEYHNKSPRQMLETWLNIHNSQVEDRKKIYVGIVTVNDSNDSLYRFTNRENTLTAIRDKLVNRLGGYLRLRRENSKMYLDWITLEEYGKYCEQAIEFGANMLDYSESLTAEDVITCLIPLGAKIDKETSSEGSEFDKLEKYVDISSVNNGKDYIYSTEAVNTFGWIRAVQRFEDVALPENLLKKGQEYLQDAQWEELVLSISAVDLSLMDIEYDTFEIGDRVRCLAVQYGMDKIFPVTELSIPLDSPENAKLQLGESKRASYTMSMASTLSGVRTELKENIYETSKVLQSAIDNATALMTGSKGGYKVTEYDDKNRWLRDLYMDSPDKETAKRIMQVNMNGIGFSRNGYNGPYENAWTIDGNLTATVITTGTMQADRIRGGKLEVGGETDGIIILKDAEGDILMDLSKEGAILNRVQITDGDLELYGDSKLPKFRIFLDKGSKQRLEMSASGQMFYDDSDKVDGYLRYYGSGPLKGLTIKCKNLSADNINESIEALQGRVANLESKG